MIITFTSTYPVWLIKASTLDTYLGPFSRFVTTFTHEALDTIAKRMSTMSPSEVRHG